ncbi:MAG: hypothetical protein E7019_01580 [Alphaproteobacteria bacterium]|nr:hypothetical protein [Alphaproteobacteria bacterium]
MFKKIGKSLGFEKSSQFATKVLVLSFPTALIFLILSMFKMVDPLLAVLSMATVVGFNIILLLPMTIQLQQIKHYIMAMSKGENIENKAMQLSEEETKDIVDAVNAMHRFWAEKTNTLEAQTISDTAVLDSLPDPILMLDQVGYIIGANLAARNSFGKNITDKNIDKLFNSHSFLRATSKVLNKESEAENLIFYVDKPIDQKLYAHIKQLPWLSKGKAVAVVSIYDLTKSLKIEKMQSDFVANASHELRTPLSIISGFIETLQTSAKDDPEAQDKFLKIMSEQAEYMSALIENLLSLSRIELNQDQAPEGKHNAKEIIEEVAQSLTIKASEREMKIKTIFETDNEKITCDRAQIKQVVQNLTDNAIKYGLSGTDITLKIKDVEEIPNSISENIATGPAIAISVNNKGPKIEPENLARLTERFYRLQEHKDLNIKGTGLGLAIVKHIVMRHRGNLTVKSNSYNGTTFTIYIPLSISQE